MLRRDFLATTAGLVALPVTRALGAAAAPRHLLYIAEPGIRNYQQYGGIGVLVYLPFGRDRLWDRVEGHAVPEWAAEFGAMTWAQFFLKFAASHPAVTAVTPATSKPHHMVDNMTAARGRLPDQAERKRMVDFIAALPG